MYIYISIDIQPSQLLRGEGRGSPPDCRQPCEEAQIRPGAWAISRVAEADSPLCKGESSIVQGRV